MEYRSLGNTGLKVSLLGLGGIPLQRISQTEVNQIIKSCLDSGVNFIDTARAYTDSEEKIGIALEGIKRDKIILATKSMARTYEAMKQDIEISLKKLKTKYIDLYQCHNIRFDEEEAIVFGANGALHALLEAKIAGKIKHIGLTCHQLDRAINLLQHEAFETVQVPYNFNEDMAEKELLPLVIEKNIGFIVMKPLGGGALPVEYAMRFFLDKPISTIIPGVDSLENFQENLKIIEAGRALEEKELAEVLEYRKKIDKLYCRRCDYCRPCPQGIDISGTFIIHGYYTRYNMQDWAIKRFKAIKVKPDECKECGLCESRCPYNLPIRQMLKQVNQDMN